MRVLFVSNYFPPEVNAPATRLHEHARQWVRDGCQVEVLTSIPNFPEGKIYEGFLNRYGRDQVDGIEVVRVPMYVAENKGTLRRTLSYLSFMLSAIWYSRRLRHRPDLVVATSPQFFAAVGGYVIARLRRVPFVLEVRDLWPESIVAVGAVRRNALIRLFERIEQYLYEHSEHIVVVTDAFKSYIEKRGIRPEKISVLKNGFDLEQVRKPLEQGVLEDMRVRLGLESRFVASYIGTIGMAHGVEVLVEAARRCSDPDVLFMVVGTGAERARIEALQTELKLPNFKLVDKQPREMVPYLLALSDVSIVHLRASPLFRTVIPSKIFESMALRRPIVLGVEGESKEIVEQAGAGIPVPPEDADALVRAVRLLRDRPEVHRGMADRGFDYVFRHHDRQKLARRYWAILEGVALGQRASIPVAKSPQVTPVEAAPIDA